MKSLLRFITCGSVDDGKSTLIGHMLYDARLLFADQKQALELESKVGSRGGEIDYSLLLDGLMAEREQGITIDVAYRYFSTEARSFIVADTPGHEEYTRNMAVGASFADLAIILVDALKGISTQTKRHTRICFLMGIRHFVFAVNKMDLIDYNEQSFIHIKQEIKAITEELSIENVEIIPVCATEGDNVTRESDKMAWYRGEPLLAYLETVEIYKKPQQQGFLMPVQRVCRPDHTFRGYQGQIESGEIRIGDMVKVCPGKECASVSAILLAGKPSQRARRGDAVTITLDREIDVSRGDILRHTGEEKTHINFLEICDLLNVTILWMDDDELYEGREYLLKIGTKSISAVVIKIKYKIDVNNGNHLAADKLYKNELASCEIATSQKIAVTRFQDNRALGGLILIDRVTNMTSACGVVEFPLRRSNNITWQKTDVTRELRAKRMRQNPLTIWFTGLSGSGKSTLANELEKRLMEDGFYTMLLDGDNLRHGLNRDLGFDKEDRIENIRRVAEIAKLMNDAGLLVLASFISPYEADRKMARHIIGDSFIEIYVSTSLEECKRRDVKGLYAKAMRGDIPNFTGITLPYEIPVHPEIAIDTSGVDVEECVESLMEFVKSRLRN